MSDRRERVLLLVLLALAVYQVASRFMIGEPSPPNTDSYIVTVPGSPIRDSILVDRRADEVSAIGDGNCRIVVFYTPTCGASAVAARQWARAEHPDGGSVLPAGWLAVWVNTASGGLPNALDTMDLPVTRGIAVNGVSLARHLAITAYPVYVVLDREGNVTESSVGALLPTVEDDAVACRLAHQVTRQ